MGSEKLLLAEMLRKQFQQTAAFNHRIPQQYCRLLNQPVSLENGYGSADDDRGADRNHCAIFCRHAFSTKMRHI